MTTNIDKLKFLDDFVKKHFIELVDQKIYSVIYDFNQIIIAATNYSARSVGFESWTQLKGLSYKFYHDEILVKALFKDAYSESTKSIIYGHIKRIDQIQKFVLTRHKIVSFFDLLPYNNIFKSYLVTYIPIYYSSNEVIGIHSFAIEARLLNFQEYIKSEVNNKKKRYKIKNLSPREHEIMFLLANGVTQDQIAQIIGVHRSTVASIIANQLCLKFDIAGSSTKMLTEIAISQKYYERVPQGLWKPSVIVLEEEVANEISEMQALISG